MNVEGRARDARVGVGELLVLFQTLEPRLSALDLAVVAALLGYMNVTGRKNTRFTCFPSHASIAVRANVSSPTVRKALVSIEATGLMSVTRRRGEHGRQSSSVYDFRQAVERVVRVRSRGNAVTSGLTVTTQSPEEIPDVTPLPVTTELLELPK
jgi:hypothetical protein